jgi:hypothetical protein
VSKDYPTNLGSMRLQCLGGSHDGVLSREVRISLKNQPVRFCITSQHPVMGPDRVPGRSGAGARHRGGEML